MTTIKGRAKQMLEHVEQGFIKDARALDFNYIPDEIVDRQGAYAFLQETFLPIVTAPIGKMALLYGPVGTGKTVTARRFAADLEAVGAQRGTKVQTVYVNCRHSTSVGIVFNEVLLRLGARTGTARGFGSWEVAQDLRRYVTSKSVRLLIIVDEVEAITRQHKDELAYFFSRMNEGNGSEGSVSLLFLNEHDIRGHFSEAALSTFTRGSFYEFEPYAEADAREIYRQRIETAFVPGSVEEGVLAVCLDSYLQTQDIRIGLEVLDRASRAARINQRSRVSVADARYAADASYGGHLEAIRGLSGRRFGILNAVAGIQRGEEPVTMGVAEQAYLATGSQIGHTQFWKHVKALSATGLLRTRLSGKGQAGTTTLIVVPDAVRRAVRDIENRSA